MMLRYIKDTLEIIKKHDKNMLFLYNKLCLKNIILTKIFKKTKGKTKIYDHTIHYGNYNSFFAMFVETFIYEIYKTKEKQNTIIDCGSNIGLATIYFLINNPKAKIHCFEPDKKTIPYLLKNTQDHKNITVHQCGVGGKNETVMFHDANTFSCNTGNSIIKKHWHDNTNTEHYNIQLRKLSSMIKEKIDYLKIDTEGTEHEILKDLHDKNMLKNVKHINLEYHHFTHKNTLPQILKILDNERFIYYISSCPVSENNFEQYKKQKVFVLIIQAEKQ